MLATIVSLWLFAAPAAPAAPAADEPAPSDDAADLREAKRLFDEGSARYDAADFAGAIEAFTLALGDLRNRGVEDFAIRGRLLFNIGRAHMRAYEIDDEVEHLRQAKSIFTAFIDEAEVYPDEVEAQDIDEARQQVAQIDELLAASEDDAADAAGAVGTTDAPPGDPKRLRASGIGLTVAGVAVLGGGVGMLVWGAGAGPAAQRQESVLDTPGVPSDSQAYPDFDEFVAAEKRKGAAWMAAGGVAAALGVVGIAFGVRQLVKAKRAEKASVTPTTALAPGGVWLGVRGKF